MLANEPFATAIDYGDRAYDSSVWTPEQLQMKLAEASRLVRDAAPNVDARIEAGNLDRERVTDIVCAMVARAVPLTDIGIPFGANSSQIGVDIFQKTVSFGAANSGGSGALYLSKSERQSLGIGTQRAFTIKAHTP